MILLRKTITHCAYITVLKWTFTAAKTP